ncbi:hypothetical protein ACH41E_23995 [Streptomyces sp. NPDC020412]|uniref:hypothetical protein n=1 Tax=Streptomyces sp. NPDC020412 TaxID=3365073 RepID=UPI0037A69D44
MLTALDRVFNAIADFRPDDLDEAGRIRNGRAPSPNCRATEIPPVRGNAVTPGVATGTAAVDDAEA